MSACVSDILPLNCVTCASTVPILPRIFQKAPNQRSSLSKSRSRRRQGESEHAQKIPTQFSSSSSSSCSSSSCSSSSSRSSESVANVSRRLEFILDVRRRSASIGPFLTRPRVWKTFTNASLGWITMRPGLPVGGGGGGGVGRGERRRERWEGRIRVDYQASSSQKKDGRTDERTDPYIEIVDASTNLFDNDNSFSENPSPSIFVINHQPINFVRCKLYNVFIRLA